MSGKSQKETQRKKRVPEEEEEPRSVLSAAGLDITALAREGKLEKIAGWEEKIDHLAEILQRRVKHHVILLGPEGAGKRSIIFGLAEKIANGNMTKKLTGCRIVELNLASIAQIAQDPEQFPRALFAAFQEALGEKHCILMIQDFHVLLGGYPGPVGPLASGHMLRAMMEQTQMSFILCTTKQIYDELKADHEWLPQLAEIVAVGEPTDEVLQSILEAVARDLGNYHGLEFEPESIELAGSLAKRFSESGPIAGFAVRLLDEAAAKVAVRSASLEKAADVTSDDVAQACAQRTNLSLSKILRSETLELLELEDILGKRVKGQAEAVSKVAGVVRMLSLGLEKRGLRASGVLMFVGPSGVGKTELARALTEARYGCESKMTVINMAQYSDEKALPRLMGSLTEDEGTSDALVRTIESKPHSVLVLKEIENSNVAVAAALSEFFRTGILYGVNGKEVSFSKGLIILTVTAENLLENAEDHPLGFWGDGITAAEMVKEVEKATERVFPPDFLESLDEIVVFKPLERDAVLEIAELRIHTIANALERQGIRLDVTRAAKELVADKGSSKNRGMRNLARALDGVIMRPVSSALLATSNASRITVDAKDGDVVVKVTGKASAKSTTRSRKK